MIITPKLDHFVKSNGTSRVFIYVYDPRSRLKEAISTPYFCVPVEWSSHQVRPGAPSAKYINPHLLTIVAELTTYAMQNPNVTPGQLKEWYRGPKDHGQPVTPKSYFRDYVAKCASGEIIKRRSKDKMTPGYIKALGTAASAFESYPRQVTWEGLDEGFLDRYVTHLRGQGFKQNTIAKYVKYLVIVANHSKRVSITYSVQQEKTNKIRLTPDEVEAIINLDLSGYPELIHEQERFHVAYSLLLRFGDSVAINEKNIILKGKRAFLSAYTQKGKKQILLPIKMSAYRILKKNGFTLRGANGSSNEKIKRIGLLAKVNSNVTVTEFRNGRKTETVYKKYQLLETHTTRRSAARHLFDAGMAPEIIMVLGGWTTMKQLLEYIDIDLDYAAQKAAEHEFFK